MGISTLEKDEARAWGDIVQWSRRPSQLSSSVEVDIPFENEHRWLVTLTSGTVFCSAHYGDTRALALGAAARWCREELAKGSP